MRIARKTWADPLNLVLFANSHPGSHDSPLGSVISHCLIRTSHFRVCFNSAFASFLPCSISWNFPPFSFYQHRKWGLQARLGRHAGGRSAAAAADSDTKAGDLIKGKMPRKIPSPPVEMETNPCFLQCNCLLLTRLHNAVPHQSPSLQKQLRHESVIHFSGPRTVKLLDAETFRFT